MSKKIKYSEIFYSFQGEGFHTGAPTVWLRFFGCNLECSGFGQESPTKPETYELPYKVFDINQIKSLEELPVWSKGCDSSYSWSSKFKHLSPKADVKEICDKLINLIPNNSFDNKDYIHLAFTGGEPMLWQDSMIDIMEELISRGNYPISVTVETNGTIPPTSKLKDRLDEWNTVDWFWSISPKLYNVSGEQSALNSDTIKEMLINTMSSGQLKFVLNNDQSSWDEVDDFVDLLYNTNSIFDRTLIYIMPVGATIESQTGTINTDLAKIADKALARGWRVSGRVHANIYGNAIAK